ncbi:hypothetical protein [Fundicoccus culcitae]|uniref:Uncharacterized protein n=1 Tax=Fundicoccus culcitae TaxID=2969821 RepID=A0ABY5PAG7_9LACT|nr:hypothetical protein [Fundicoccus culcitae]UUX35413.1 hypothetical protein NRE15_07150 [Fundicoccus culcitae]
MAKKYIVEEFEPNMGLFKSNTTKIYKQIADYANKKNLTIIKVSDIDEKGNCTAIFEEN